MMSAPCGRAPSCEQCPFPDCTWNGSNTRAVDPEKRREAQRRYRKKNAEKYRAYNREYYRTHKEAMQERDRKRYAKVKDKAKAYDAIMDMLQRNNVTLDRLKELVESAGEGGGKHDRA